MTNPNHDTSKEHHGHLRSALDHAHRLSQEPRPESTYSVGWSAQAAQVGDLSVLALALRD